MKFTRITSELYGARKAGFKLDPASQREYDHDAMAQIYADIGERYVDSLFDSFCDADGDLYSNENGEYYFVLMRNGKPLIWQRACHV